MRQFMKNISITFFLGLIVFLSHGYGINTSILKDGDIIFQETNSEQAKAIKYATRSKYTHVGIIFTVNNSLMVLEAVQPVKLTSLNTFIKRSVHGHYVIKRLKNYNEIITAEKIDKMKKIGFSYLGKNYDIYFEWNDKRIYCTELVWKIYKNALNIEVGKLQRLRDFDLSHPYVKKLMQKRYGSKIPLDELVISPEEMFQSDNLVTIMTN